MLVATACDRAASLEFADTNVVLITLDTTRADALGAYGQSLPTTPNLDRLAASGVVFEQHVAAAPLTLTSHASIFTGLHPPNHGVRANLGYALAGEHLTLAEVLRDAGYVTGAEIAATVLRRRTQIAQGFDFVGDTDTPGVSFEPSEGDAAHELDLVRAGSDITRGALAFLRKHRDERFFLWLHYFDPHAPYAPPAALARRFPNHPYLAEVASADEQVGAVMEELGRLDLTERTLVIVTSDHGEGLGEHGEPTHSYFVYDTTMRAPLIVAGPNALPAGHRVGAVTRSVDVAPTVLDLLGLPSLPKSDGVSLRRLLDRSENDLGLVAYGESLELREVLGTTPLRLLREGRWKYIHKVNPELYDVATDPDEQDDRASAEPETVARLQEALVEFLSEVTPLAAVARIALDDVTRANLEALGYIAPASEAALPDEHSMLAPTGSDPSAHTEDLALVSFVKGDMSKQRYARALARLEGLGTRHPQSGHIARLLGEAHFGLEQYDESIAAFERSVRQEPGNDANLRGLVRALEEVDRTEEAVTRLALFAAQFPCSQVRGQLARRLHALGRDAEQARVLADGVDACPDAAALFNDLAWLLATSRDDTVRDGAAAVAAAERGIGVSGGAVGANELDTLAAAHAEAGDFVAAQATEQQAIDVLMSRGASDESLSGYRTRLADYEQGRPARD